MKRKGQILAACMLLFVLMLSGCGSKEIVMKEFTSQDGSVSIQMNEAWNFEDMGSGSEGWVAAFTKDGSEGMVVMQVPKVLSGANITDMDDWKEQTDSIYEVSQKEAMDALSVPGMDVEGAYRCTITASGVEGAGCVLYGETEYAYYSIIYAAPKMNDKQVEYYRTACTTFKETAPEVENNSTVASTDTIQWFNSSCAVLTALNGWDYTMFGGLPANGDSQALVQQMLSEWWEVTDRASADENMEWILAEGHRTSFADDMEYLKEIGVGETGEEDRYEFLLENFDIDEETAENYVAWYSLYEQSGEDALAGWDYSRAMSLLGFYYLAGYYTEQEALDKSLEVAGEIQGTFGSWDDLMESYFVGYEYWAEESSDDRRDVYNDLKAASDSPYNLDFNLKLEKSW